MAQQSAFKRFLEPLDLGFTTLRNRSVMGSIHSGLEEAKDAPYKKMARYFGERAKGEVGLIITGGVAPNFFGKVHPWGSKMTTTAEAKPYKEVTDAVHAEGGKIALQILHTGRYSYFPLAVAPSAIPSPIWKFNPMIPMKMPGFYIKQTVKDFARCAQLAREAGFDGVEIMGSEGYLINEFIAKRTNKRTDEYGGSYENRIRFALEIIRATKKACGDDFIIVFRLSMIDLVKGGSTAEEVNQLAEEVSKAGATIINTGIGWHEARVPTIQTAVPRAAFTWVTKTVRDHLRSKGINTPIVATNRINTPEVAEEILARGDADMVCMARPFLADANFVAKARAGRPQDINICIGCNQACLDHVFRMKTCSCLVNPVACHETTLTPTPIKSDADRKHIVVVGGGPAGCGFAMTAAERGHNVTLYESSNELGGQFHLARRIPGKDEFLGSINYWKTMLQENLKDRVEVKLNSVFEPEKTIGVVSNERFGKPAAVVLASGSSPRSFSVIKGAMEAAEKLPNCVVSYKEVLLGQKKVGKRTAIIGSGGIGFDVSKFLFMPSGSMAVDDFCKTWGIDKTRRVPGGLLEKNELHKVPEGHSITMFQRKAEKFGKTLGATTGWIHRKEVSAAGIKQIGGVIYDSIEPSASGDSVVLNITHSKGGSESFEFDTIVMCHGQVPNDQMASVLKSMGVDCHRIGGALEAAELDAKRAIREGHELAMAL